MSLFLNIKHHTTSDEISQDVQQSLNPFMQRCHCIGQIIKSHFLVNESVLVIKLHISNHSGHYCIISDTPCLKNVNVVSMFVH